MGQVSSYSGRVLNCGGNGLKVKIKATHHFEAWQIPHDKGSELTREIPLWIIAMFQDDELVLVDKENAQMAKVKSYYGWIPANQGDYIIHTDNGHIFVCPEMEFDNIFDITE